MKLITIDSLNRALWQVDDELDTFGFYDEKLQDVDVYLCFFGTAYGYQKYGNGSEILIPRVSLSRLPEFFGWAPTVGLRDILRHEYAHAIADTHRGLMRSRRFRQAFAGPHNWVRVHLYDPERHVTRYASTSPAEDFAEVFMFFLKHHGRLPVRFRTKAIRKKWGFIDQLAAQISSGHRRWRA